MNELQDKMRIIQELVPGKQISIAHVIANPDPVLYQKLGLDPSIDYTKAAIGVVTISPAETAIIIADIAIKASGVDLSFVDRFSGTLIVTGTVSEVEAALRALCDYARANKDKAAVEAALSLISKLDADYRQNGLWSINSSRSPSAGFIRVKVLSDEERPSYVGEALQAIAKLKAITGMKKISDAEDSAKRIGGSFAQNYDGVGASIKLASFVGDKSI